MLSYKGERYAIKLRFDSSLVLAADQLAEIAEQARLFQERRAERKAKAAPAI